MMIPVAPMNLQEALAFIATGEPRRLVEDPIQERLVETGLVSPASLPDLMIAICFISEKAVAQDLRANHCIVIGIQVAHLEEVKGSMLGRMLAHGCRVLGKDGPSTNPVSAFQRASDGFWVLKEE